MLSPYGLTGVNAQASSLYYGNSRTPVAHAAPDAVWPGLWRIHWPDGQISDLTNLTRAKDAAEVISERGPPRRDHKLFRWKSDPCETPAKAVPVRPLNGRAFQ